MYLWYGDRNVSEFNLHRLVTTFASHHSHNYRRFRGGRQRYHDLNEGEVLRARPELNLFTQHNSNINLRKVQEP